jgi:hypothetical protein
LEQRFALKQQKIQAKQQQDQWAMDNQRMMFEMMAAQMKYGKKEDP